MAIALSLTDGTTSVVLSSTDGVLADYYPATAAADAESISETISVNLINTLATIDANMVKIEKLLEQARNYQRNPESYTMVYLSLTLDANTWTSPVFDGIIESTPAMLSYERATGTRDVKIRVNHAPYWEGAEATVLITNGNGTDQTQLNIKDANDGTGSSPNKINNYVEIPATQITGDTPSPAKISIGPTTALTDASLYIHHAVEILASLPKIYYEAEDGTGGTKTANATSSGAFYHAITWAGDAWSKVWYVDIAASDVLKLKYMDYEILAAFYGVPAATVYFQVKLSSNNGTNVIWTGPIKKATTQGILSLGVAKIPPGYAVSWGKIRVEIYARKAGGGACDLDYIQLSPTESVMRVEGIYMASSYSGIEIDGNNDRVSNYIYLGPGGGTGNLPLEWSGDYIYLYPGKLQRLYFLWGNTAGVVATDTLIVTISYKPRRRVL